MQNYSLTFTGIIVAIAGSLLVHAGFSDQCSNEIVQVAPVIIGGILSYFGRLRAGGVTPLGFRKS